MIRTTTMTLLLSSSLLSLSFADNEQARRIADVNYQYCLQESFANEVYCSCIADIYEEQLMDTYFTDEEEQFVIQALGGQLVFDAVGEPELKIIETLSQKLDSSGFEDQFIACFAFTDDQGSIDESLADDESLTDEQRYAIQELEAIEAMEDDEGYDEEYDDEGEESQFDDED